MRSLAAAVGALVLLAVPLTAGCSSSSPTAAPATTAAATVATGPGSTTTTSPGASSGSTLDSFPPGTVAVDVSQTSLGTVLVDGTGYTLYAFAPDANGTTNCVDPTCTATWPPLTGTAIAVSADAGSGAGGLFKLITRPDGLKQLAVAGRPVYRYSGDTKPGDTSGQGVGGQWFAINPDGTLVQG